MKRLVIPLFLALLIAGASTRAGAEDHLEKGAMEALKWIRSTAVKTDSGLAWPAVPGTGRRLDPYLYHGSAGVVLFLLEAYRTTRDKACLQEASASADHLISVLDHDSGLPCGLYNGMAGLGFVLGEVFEATGKEKYRKHALEVVRRLRKRARKEGSGVEWNDTTDIIRGGAGIGLYLLHASKALDYPPARALAEKAGKRLVDLGKPVEDGLMWFMQPTYRRTMPNFSHGTAGVAYFLATLHQATKDKAFLDAALKGAAYLESIAKKTEEGTLIFHHEPGGKDLFYLGWCHGPPGTARLYYRLHRITGDKKWRVAMEKSAAAILSSGIPEKQTPGFWNNAGVCCGSAGVAEFFLALHRITGEKRYLTFARRVTRHLLGASTLTDGARKWIQAEHRVRPDLLQAQTGYMQGAAGIGLWLLRLNAFLKRKTFHLTLPDSPY